MSDIAGQPTPRKLNIFVLHASEMLTDHLPHGDGLIAYQFLHRLAERGHTVHVAACAVDVRRPLPPTLHLHRITISRDGRRGRLHFMLRMRVLFERLQRTVPFDLLHQMNPVFTGISLGMLGTQLPLVLGTYVARWPAGQQNPAEIRNTGLQHRTIALLQQLAADRLLLTTHAAWNRLPVPALVQHKIRSLSHGVETEMFHPGADAWSEQRLTAEQAQPTVLFVANIARRKGILPLLRAWKNVVAELPQARLTVAGSGPDLPAMKALAMELRLKDCIVFLGSSSRDDVPALLRQHAVYVLPSFGEPYAGSLLEAMSCGRPVVITAAGGLPEMVPPDGGLRVPVDNPAALAAALLQLLRHPDQRHSMGQVNRAAVLRHFAWNGVMDRLEGIHGELVRRSRT